MNYHMRWKTDCLQQCGMKKIMGKTRWAIANHSKRRFAYVTGGSVYLVEIEEDCSLRATPENQIFNY